MYTYTIDPEQRTRLVRALMLRLAATFSAVIVIGLAIAAFFFGGIAIHNTITNIAVMAIALVVLAVIIILRLVQQVRAYDRSLASLKIELNDERIIKKQAGYADTRIARNEVTALIETEAGTLVMTKSKAVFLWVPVQVTSYSDARSRLGSWMAIRQLPPRPGQQQLLTTGWALATAVVLGVMLFATDPWQVVLAGAAVIAIYLYVYRLLRKQRGIDLRFRRTYSGVLMFLVIVVAIKLWMTLSPILLNR